MSLDLPPHLIGIGLLDHRIDDDVVGCRLLDLPLTQFAHERKAVVDYLELYILDIYIYIVIHSVL
jgi:hypothetical protein